MSAQLLTTILLKHAKWFQTVHTAVQLTRNNWNHLSGCKTQLQICIKKSYSLISSPHKQTYWSLGFWPFTIAQFNTTLWIFCDWFQQTGMRRGGCRVGFPTPTTVQITLRLVKLCLHALWHETVFQTFNVFYASKMCLSFIKNNFNAFDALLR